MIKTHFLLFMLVQSLHAFSQQADVKAPALGVHFFLNDFNTPLKIKDKGIGQLFNPVVKDMKAGLSFSYLKGLSSHIDLSITASGSFLDYTFSNRPAFGAKSLLLQFTSMFNFKLNTDKKFFTPYMTAGAGVSQYKSYYGLYIPAGLGLQFNFKDEAYLLLQSHYSFAVTKNVSDNICHSIGIAGNIKKKKTVRYIELPKPAPIIVPEQDRDGDGVLDSNDKCPDKPGPVSLQGCPDTDGDGIIDDDDKCPAVAGYVRYNGCPIPDADGDGVNDEIDSCVHEPGLALNNGCPVVDTAIVQKINLAARQIFFETGKATLLSASYKALDDIAQLLTANPNYKVIIEGHTDNKGTVKANEFLSENRAKAVVDYLAGKNIAKERMQSKGFGQDVPIADNKTTRGRAKNRRVEIKVSL